MLVISLVDTYFWVTVGDRTWVRIRKSTISYPNPSTVTYGHPKKQCFLQHNHLLSTNRYRSYKIIQKTTFLRVTVVDRTWVWIRESQFSFSNPSTVTYGHPQNCFFHLTIIWNQHLWRGQNILFPDITKTILTFYFWWPKTGVISHFG